MNNTKSWIDGVNEWMRKLIPNGDLLFESEVDELTKHEKARNVKNAINTYKKGLSGYNGIKSFGILSAENPDSQPVPRNINKKNMKSLADSLKTGHYPFVRQKGHFGSNDEWSYFIFNITLETLIYYAAEYEQTSFFYCTLENGMVKNDYYQKRDITKPFDRKQNPYVFIESYNGYMDATDAEDYSIIGKDFKYTIPLKCFETVNRMINHNLEDLRENKHINLNIDHTFTAVGQTAWYHRAALYKGIYDLRFD